MGDVLGQHDLPDIYCCPSAVSPSKRGTFTVYRTVSGYTHQLHTFLSHSSPSSFSSSSSSSSPSVKTDYSHAIECYAKAIELCPAGRPEVAAYYANRAHCHMKLEAYESCVEDCTSALDNKEDYFKVRLRR